MTGLRVTVLTRVGQIALEKERADRMKLKPAERQFYAEHFKERLEAKDGFSVLTIQYRAKLKLLSRAFKLSGKEDYLQELGLAVERALTENGALKGVDYVLEVFA